jgi:NitT/TauT family transport system substrate-binding protein
LFTIVNEQELLPDESATYADEQIDCSKNNGRITLLDGEKSPPQGEIKKAVVAPALAATDDRNRGRGAVKTSSAGLTIVALLFAAMAGASANAAEQFTLMFGQKTATASEAPSYFTPKHLGFFKDEGIEVTLQPTEGATQEMQLLAAGNGDAGLGAPPAILLARENGANVRAIFNSVASHGTAIAVMADGPIKDPKDLKGKKIGVLSMGASRTLDGYAMVEAAGLNPKTDVEWLPVGFGVRAALALQRGDVQALVLWDLTYADMEANGFKLKYFTFPFQKDIFGYVAVTTDEKLAARRDAIVKLLRAIAKATIFQKTNPEATACIYLIESGRWDAASDKAIAYKAALAVVEQTAKYSSITAEGVGQFPAGSWEKVRDYYVNLGVAKKKLPAGDYYVTDPAFYAEINKFDRSKIEAMARAYPNKCKGS